MKAAFFAKLRAARHIEICLQDEISECGLACLIMISRFYGRNVGLAQMRKRFGPAGRGVSLKTLVNMADRMGLLAHGIQVDIDSLSTIRLPAVLHWDMNHFVILERVKSRRFKIIDPSGGSRWYIKAELSKHFTGVALELEPSLEFDARQPKSRLQMRQLWSSESGLIKAFSQVAILSLLLQAMLLVGPYYTQIAVDIALPRGDISLLTTAACAFGAVAVLNGWVFYLRSYTLLLSGSAISQGISVNLARRLFRLPISWFSSRHIGDIMSRFQSVNPLRQMLTEEGPAVVVDLSISVITGFVMLVYSFKLFLAFATAAGGYIILRITLYKLQKEAQNTLIRESGREQSILIESIRSIRTLRMAGIEAPRLNTWKQRLFSAISANIRLQKARNIQSALQTMLFGLENAISIWIAVLLVSSERISLGMMFAFMAYKTQCQAATLSFIDKVVNFRMLGLHLERMSDIALTDEDESYAEAYPTNAVFNGSIELKNIIFSYGMDETTIINRLDLKIEPGEFVAITGPSGCGKSTLLNILVGLIKPTSGSVLVDGTELSVFGTRNYQFQTSVVMQDDVLLSGSIMENIVMFSENQPTSKVIEIARQACIHDDIMRMPLGYETLVGEMGLSLSGGQRQRVLLARALYREPRLLIMDEATSHLDTATEKKISAELKNLGITRLAVAHRKETLTSADRVLLFKDGTLIDYNDHVYTNVHS